MPRPIEARIHADALAHNLSCARRRAPDAKVWAVVKANAYGHGIERAYPGLQSADGFAMLDLAEAERVRALGWRGPILLLEGCFEARDLELCSRLNLWHVVHHESQIDWLATHKTTWPHHVYLKMNSGMNRLGFSPQAFRHAWQRLSGLTQVDAITLMTHLSDADASPAAARGVAHQIEAFEAATHDLAGERSLCNSAATLRYAASRRELRGDWVRPGIMLYGSSPDFPHHSIGDWDLQPTMTLRSRLIGTQQLQAGDTVGYGSSFTAEHAMRIGIVACGYADGYPRHAGTGTPVLVNGVRTRTVGRVSMDMIAVDLTPVPEAQVGSEATLWGLGPNGSRLPIDEVAQAAGTIGYELMCAVAQRVPVHAA
ncbi:alanine racemase [Piscinibacter sp. HJYY11]|uniref:alanine racemase n=1 Tax=Piscinibacter sp. HJYY11 TaxID=2801333 RepID=UPI0019202ACD|nr:alanine racemase [Piscinibacter sp. HJYY11]MBL0729287.1 alanine racemase [Piscinibacter sp. HJYY11]